MFTKENCGFEDLLVGFSVVAVIFALLAAQGADMYLAATQWMLVATMLCLWGIYLKINKK